MKHILDFRQWLHSELMLRCKKNSSYSLRSFSLLLRMHSSSVSQIMSGKRKVSKNMIGKICDRLNAPAELKESFLNQSSDNFLAVDEYNSLTEDMLAMISNWYHPAILELIFVSNFKANSEWIADQLSLTVEEVTSAVERLKRLNLIQEKDGRLLRSEQLITAYTPDQTTEAKKNHQRQVVKMGLDAIDLFPIEERDMSNMTMAINSKKLPEAKKLIKKFRRDLCTFLSDGEKNQVYQLGIQLYPLSKKA
jgi:uncharacterized protein (TIGR02147 family)